MEILIILGLILLNGLLSMSEIAMVSARKNRLETEAKQGNRAARKALRLANKPDRFLSTVQIGITLIGILTGLYSGERLADEFAIVIARNAWLAPHAHAIAQGIIVALVTYLTLILGELVPKRLGMNAAEKIAKLMAAPMELLSKVAAPFVWLLSASTALVVRLLGFEKNEEGKVTEEEIKAIIQEGKDDGEVQEVEQNIVERVFNLGNRNIGSIMTHRSDLTWIDIKSSNEEIRRTVEDHLYNIYPVADSSLDHLMGVVSLKDLFGKLDTPDFHLQQVIRPARFFPENQSVYNALEQLKTHREKYGLVIDEFGTIEGIVTLKDIVKALIGDLPNADEEPAIIRRSDGSYLVDGQCPFYDFLAHFDREDLYEQHDYNTLSGLILEILEHIPRSGETLSWQCFDMEIIDMDGARIDKILVQLSLLPEEE